MKKRLLSAIATLVMGTGISQGQVLPPAQSPGTVPPMFQAGWVPDALPVLPVSTAPAAPAPTFQAPAASAPATDERPFLTPQAIPLADHDPFGCTTTGDCTDPHGKKFNLFGCAWVSADWLSWWVRSAPSPIPLVTTGPPGTSGFLNAPGTSVVYGGTALGYPALFGGRFAAGFCDPTYQVGLEFNAFFLSTRSTNFLASSSATGSPVLARPFVDAQLGLEDSQLISFPGAFAGGIAIDSSINMWGAEANLLRHKITHKYAGDLKLAGACFDTDALVGFRFVNLDESLGMTQVVNVLPGGVAGFAGAVVMSPNSLTIADQFRTRNNFYGGQVGFQSILKKGCCFAGVTGKIALGDTYQSANVVGTTTLSTPAGAVATGPGGLFALPSNIGVHSKHAFSVIPEIGFNIGVEVFTHVRIYGGYNFLYWTDVVRPGDQLDRSINKTQLPSSLSFGPLTGPVRPVTTLQNTDFWAQGINVGVAVRY